MAIAIRKKETKYEKLSCREDSIFWKTWGKSGVVQERDEVRVTLTDGKQFLGTIVGWHSSNEFIIKTAKGDQRVSPVDHVIERKVSDAP